MPLNINTLGTGVGGSGSGGGIAIQNNQSYRLVSTASITNVSKLDMHSNTYECSLNSDSYRGRISFNDDTYALYNGCLYFVSTAYTNNNTTYELYKYELSTLNDGNTIITRTLIPTSFNPIEDDIILQLGKYLYIFKNNSAYSGDNYVGIYRFDGTSFTEIANAYTSIMTTLFNDSNLSVSGTYTQEILRVRPIVSEKNDQILCMIEYRIGSGGYWSSVTGIFSVDDNGFTKVESHRMENVYWDSASIIDDIKPQTSLLIDANTYNKYEIGSSKIVKKKIQINWKLVNSSTSTNRRYTRSLTELESSNISTKSSINTNTRDIRLVRASYPTYDTYFLACIAKKNSSSIESMNVYTPGEWFQLKFDSKGWVTTDVTATVDSSTTAKIAEQARYGISLTLVTNASKPYFFIRRGYLPDSSYSRNFVEYRYITWDASYDSEGSKYYHKIYLESGDTIRCDDGIISVTVNDKTTTVNKTTHKVTSSGLYTIITNVSDAYAFPSIVILDKNGNIVYVRYDDISDTAIDGYFLKGMKVNGVVVPKSAKASYTNENGRFSISMN